MPSSRCLSSLAVTATCSSTNKPAQGSLGLRTETLPTGTKDSVRNAWHRRAASAGTGPQWQENLPAHMAATQAVRRKGASGSGRSPLSRPVRNSRGQEHWGEPISMQTEAEKAPSKPRSPCTYIGSAKLPRRQPRAPRSHAEHFRPQLSICFERVHQGHSSHNFQQ